MVGFGQSRERADRMVALCALLDRGRAVTLAELREAGLYPQPSFDAARQQFERDKRDLRTIGVDVVTLHHDETPAYRIERATPGVPVTWSDDEAWTLAVLAATIGDPATGTSLATLGTRSGDYPPLDTAATVAVDLPLQSAVMEALAGHRVVAFDYAAATGEVTRRRIEPWRTVPRRGLWYLTGFDLDRQAPRVFRTDRIRGTPRVGEPASHPVPDGRGLSLVPDDGQPVVMEVDAARTIDATRLGGEVIADAGTRSRLGGDPIPWVRVRFPYMRAATALGWALRHGAAIVEPGELAAQAAARREHIRALHAGPPTDAPSPTAPGRSRRTALTETRLRRLLELPRWLAEKPGVTVAETATAFGCTVEDLRAELDLLDLADVPGIGTVVSIEYEGDSIVAHVLAGDATVQLRLADAFRLLVLSDTARRLLPGDELPALDAVEATLRKATGLDPTAVAADLVAADARVPRLRGAIEAGQAVRFPYRGRHDDDWSERRVLPATLRLANGALYLLAHDLDVGQGRSFRLDRMGEITVEDIARVDVEIDVETPRYVPTDDEVDVRLRLRPGGTWLLALLEPAGEPVVDDDDVIAIVRTDNPGWLIGHVLASGGDVEVLGPPDVRAAVLEHLTAGSP